jgi:hypothetical protein
MDTDHNWSCTTRRTGGSPLCDCGARPFPVPMREIEPRNTRVGDLVLYEGEPSVVLGHNRTPGVPPVVVKTSRGQVLAVSTIHGFTR